MGITVLKDLEKQTRVLRRKIAGVILFIFLVAFILYLANELYRLDKIYFLSPIEYKTEKIIIRKDDYGDGAFAARRNGGRKHRGIDLEADVGEAVYASSSATVVAIGFHPRGFGDFIELAHLEGYDTIYAHLSKVNVSENQFVRQGDKIGEVGKTGNANNKRISPHLHFEVRINNVPQDPMEYLGRADIQGGR